MAVPDFNPRSQTSRITLTSTGSYDRVASALPIGVYANSPTFITGAVDQVSYTYKMLGGDILDIELLDTNIYAAYEDSVLEYSKIVNLYQAKSSLSSFLGTTTGSFDSDGNIVSGSSLSGSNAALKFPRFSITYARRVGDEIAYETGIGGNIPFYTASVDIIDQVQYYDLQSIVSSSAASGGVGYADAVNASNNAKIRINRVWYKSPSAVWRFFGYYGGLTVVGNLNSYGQYADDSTFDVVPAWQNKLQAINYETNLFTRTSHYSYEIKNNKLKIFPMPTGFTGTKMWFEFSIDTSSPIDEITDSSGNVIGGNNGIGGVNNLNSLPFENIPYENINSMGKQWIRRYALAVAKEMLSHIRGKISSGIPIPGETIQLDHAVLAEQAIAEMEKLKEELKLQLEATTYDKLAETEANIVDNAIRTQRGIPKGMWVG